MYSSPKKSFYQRLSWGRKQAVALQEQHRLRPFTHEATLSFVTAVDVVRFRRRISYLNRQRFDIVWFREVAKGEQREHYHLILRTGCTKREFESYICDCLSQRKGSYNNSLRSQFRLHWEEIDSSRELGLWLYSSKSTAKTLRQNELMVRGCRETWNTGTPFDRNKRQLVSTPARHTAKILALVANDPDIGAAVVDGRLLLKQLWDMRFHWMYNMGYYRGIGLLGRFARMAKSGSLTAVLHISSLPVEDVFSESESGSLTPDIHISSSPSTEPVRDGFRLTLQHPTDANQILDLTPIPPTHAVVAVDCGLELSLGFRNGVGADSG